MSHGQVTEHAPNHVTEHMMDHMISQTALTVWLRSKSVSLFLYEMSSVLQRTMTVVMWSLNTITTIHNQPIQKDMSQRREDHFIPRFGSGNVAGRGNE